MVIKHSFGALNTNTGTGRGGVQVQGKGLLKWGYDRGTFPPTWPGATDALIRSLQ